jgi:hypothetical protein
MLNHSLDKLKPLLDIGNVVVAQKEVSTIVRSISLDAVTGDQPDDDPEAFAEYLRSSLHRKTGSHERDLSEDPWGTPYHLNYRSNERFVVMSAGPDKVFQTNDDIRAGN